MSYFHRPRGNVSAQTVKATALVADTISLPGDGQRNVLSSDDLVPTVGYDVFLLAGQSNMVGTSYDPMTDELDPADDDILQWGLVNKDQVVPGRYLEHPNAVIQSPSIGYSFALKYRSLLKPGRKILLVPAAMGGTGPERNPNLDTHVLPNGEYINLHWNKEPRIAGDLFYENLTSHAIRRTNLAMAYHPVFNPNPKYTGTQPPPKSPYNEFKGILWLQGENGGLEAPYKQAIVDLINLFRTQITGASNATPFIAGYFTKWNLDLSATYPDPAPIVQDVYPKIGNVAYMGVPNCWFADSRYPYYLESSTRPDNNPVHYSGQALREYGSRFFEQYLAYLTGVKPEITAMQATCTDYSNGIAVSWTASANTATVDISLIDSVKKYYNNVIWSVQGVTGNSYTLTPPTIAPGTYWVRVTPRAKNGVSGPVTAVNEKQVVVPATNQAYISAPSLIANANTTILDGVKLEWTGAASNVSVFAGNSYQTATRSLSLLANVQGNTYTVPAANLSSSSWNTITLVPRSASNVAGANVSLELPQKPGPPTNFETNVASNGAWLSWDKGANSVTTKLSYSLASNTANMTYLQATMGNIAFVNANGVFTTGPSPYEYAFRATSFTGAVPGGSADALAWWDKTDGSLGDGGLYLAIEDTALPTTDTLGNTTLTTQYTPPLVVSNATRGYVLQANLASLTPGWFATSKKLNKSYTLSAWVIPPVTANAATMDFILGGRTATAATNYYYLGFNKVGTTNRTLRATQQGVYADMSDARVLDSGTALAANTWYHVAQTYDYPTNKMVLYVNGSQVANASLSTFAWHSSFYTEGGPPVQIGIMDSSSPYFTWRGHMDSVRVYDRVLSAAEMSTIYARDQLKNNLKLRLPFGKATVPTSSYGTAVTTFGTPVMVQAPGRGYVLNTSNGGLDVALYPTAPFTVSAWVYSGAPSGYVLGFGTNSTPGSPTSKAAVLYVDNNKMRVLLFKPADSSAFASITDPTNVPTNTWTHFAATYSGNNLVLYRNGVSVGTATSTTGWNDTESAEWSLRIGAANWAGDYTTSKFTGYLDSVRLWNRALSSQNIQTLYDYEVGAGPVV